MGTLTDAGRARVANHIISGTSTTAYTPYYALLISVTDANAGNVTEVNGGGYTRKTATWGTISHSNGITTAANSAKIEFPTATDTWGTPVAVGKYDASTGGTLLEVLPLAVSDQVAISANVRFVLDAGKLTSTIS